MAASWRSHAPHGRRPSTPASAVFLAKMKLRLVGSCRFQIALAETCVDGRLCGYDGL
jgi:hypothetical protein